MYIFLRNLKIMKYIGNKVMYNMRPYYLKEFPTTLYSIRIQSYFLNIFYASDCTYLLCTRFTVYVVTLLDNKKSVPRICLSNYTRK